MIAPARQPFELPTGETRRRDGTLKQPEVLSAGDVLRFARDGFLHLRNVLNGDEVHALRRAIASFAETAKASGHVLKPSTDELVPVTDLLGMPDVGWLVSDARLTGIARDLIGRNDLVYFGDSGVMVGGKNRGFHKDNANRDTADDADWLSPYTLVRFGIYLDEHARQSGGLKVRRGSHLHVDVTTGAIVDVPTRPGDVVVWSLRTTHSGFAVRTRGPWSVPLPPRVEIRLPTWLTRPGPQRRIAAFLTYGTNDHHSRNYIAKHTNTAAYPDNYLFQSWLYSDGSEETAARLREAGVTMLRPIPEYGSKYGVKTRIADGHIVPGRARPDEYPVGGTERWIRRAGAGVRWLRRA